MINLIHFLNQTSILNIWLLQILVSYGLLLIMLRAFGAKGVMAMMAVLMIAANIQVLKAVEFPFYNSPLPLGTALFATTYLASDILIEYYDKAMAKQAILLAIAGFVIMAISMIISMGFKPLSFTIAKKTGMLMQYHVQHALYLLFSPAPALFTSSIVSFFCSQRFEIYLFSLIRSLTGDKALWLRNNVSTWTAALIDNIIFNTLAWRLFNPHPISWHELIFGYILGTYLIRAFMAVMDTPFIYLAKYFVPKKPTIAQN